MKLIEQLLDWSGYRFPLCLNCWFCWFDGLSRSLQTHPDLFEWGKILAKLLLRLRSSLLHKIILVLLVLDDDTVAAYQVIAVVTVDLSLFIMILASWRRGHLDQNLLDFSLFSAPPGLSPCAQQYFHFLMNFHTLLTNELSAVSTVSGSLASWALYGRAKGSVLPRHKPGTFTAATGGSPATTFIFAPSWSGH